MKIGVVGCGALGSYYGARLCRAGQEVHFLLRSDYEMVRARGVRVLSPEGDFTAWPFGAGAPEEIGKCDLVLIGLKTTANDQFRRLLPPLVGATTLVLTLQNGLGSEEQLAALFGPEPILGGLCFVCLNRLEPGRIRHMAHGKIVLGEWQREPTAHAEAIANLFRQDGVPCVVAPNLEQAHWEKLVWNIPFNGLGVAAASGYDAVIRGEIGPDRPLGPCLTTDQLLGDPQWERLVRELMREVIAAANGLGFRLSETLVEHQIERTRVMGAYKASTLVDYERGLPLEIEAMFRRPCLKAKEAGVSTPRLQALCIILDYLDKTHCLSR